MKIAHLEQLKPVCPVCRRQGIVAEVRCQTVCREAEGDILEGVLVCSNADCCREYPIIDGIPLLVADLRSLLTNSLWQVLQRSDLSEPLESLLGDACGPGSSLDTARQHLSAYAWDHYAEFDPCEAVGTQRPGIVRELVDLPAAELSTQSGLVLDLGCATGRATFELAARHPDALVVGIDLNLCMLRLASLALREQRVCYPRRRIGLVYDRREFPVNFPGAERVDFWACDATALPFVDGAAGYVQALNLLDCLPDPLAALQEWRRAMRQDGYAWLTCPFDWNPAATPFENWLGGHSQRGPGSGDGAALLRSLLTTGGHPQSVAGLSLVREWDAVTWRVRCHDRSVMEYAAYAALVSSRPE